MTRFLPTTIIASLAVIALPVGAAQAQLVTTPADLGTAVAAQIACASIFVTGRAEADVLRDDVHALAPFTRTIALSVNRTTRTVTASASDTTPRTALYRPAVGCTLMTGTVPVATLERQVSGLKAVPKPNERRWMVSKAARTATAATPIDRTALAAAVRRAFDEQNKDGYPDTRAILVVHRGEIVAEQYAPGFDRNSRLLGWSATKSIAGTLIGLLVDDGVLKLDAPAPVPEWQQAGDPRGKITLRQLLTMSSGLAFKESYEPGNDSIRMLFETSDMAAYAAGRPAAHAPGSAWSYSSGTTNILSAIVFRATGGTLEGVTRFARKRLFEPAGMPNALIAPDEAGVPVGSSYGYATARDWARFGMLYLNGGKVGGKQLLSREWVDFALTPTPAAPRPLYGAQIWLNRDGDAAPRKRILDGVPADSFMAMGHNHQIVAVIPSQEAVIVRLGWTPEGQSFDWNKHISAISAALNP